MKRWLLAALLAGCFGPDEPIKFVDASVDAPVVDAPIDACVDTPSDGCCSLLPDEDAVRECVIESVNPGDCGVVVCRHADCTDTRLNFCAPDQE